MVSPVDIFSAHRRVRYGGLQFNRGRRLKEKSGRGEPTGQILLKLYVITRMIW